MDLVIKGGLVVDGSGLPRYRADVGVDQGRIVEIGKIGGSARRVLDADGLVVAPGFIDVHTHYDAQLIWDPLATSSCWHGYTTVVIGNAGLTVAPVAPDKEVSAGLFGYLDPISTPALAEALPWNWPTYAAYMDALDERLGLNVVPVVGHPALRYSVMGPASTEREATPRELEEMIDRLKQEMRAGAMGFGTYRSTGRFGRDAAAIPSTKASPQELMALAEAFGAFETGIIVITPVSVKNDLRAGEKGEMFGLAKASGRPVVWTAISPQQRLEEAEEELALSEAASHQGVSLFATVKIQEHAARFTLKRTAIFKDVPGWRPVMTLSPAEKLRALKDHKTRAELQRGAEGTLDWQGLVVSNVAREENRRFEGQSIAAIASMTKKSPIDAFCDLTLEENLETRLQLSQPSGEYAKVLRRAFRSSHAMLGLTDGGNFSRSACYAGEATTLLGTWVRKEQALGIEEAVYRMSFLPASMLGITDRGLVRKGMWADLVVFDPATVGPGPEEAVTDMPGGEERFIQRAAGVHWTVVNGKVLIEHGKPTGEFPGRVVRNHHVQPR